MAKLTHDELVSLYNQKRINVLLFVMNSERADDFLKFCHDRCIEPSLESANLFLDFCGETDIIR